MAGAAASRWYIPAGRAILPAVFAIRRILCPVDFSETSREAVEYALVLANKCAAELVIVHVVEEAPLVAAYSGLPEIEVGEEVEKLARKELADLAAGHASSNVPLRSELLRGGTAKTIERYAAEQHMDLIVMGTHGRGLLDHAIFGSVTEHVMRRAQCPVLIVRHPAGRASFQAERK